MATMMPPPMVTGFSLRVQLFSPAAHAPNDKPLRSFRVVTTPEATVQDFCAEASRIHQINYGEPIAIKKIQDDLEFDITQSEIIGTMFTNLATVRVIQANAIPGVRDSVPPTSALRFDPQTQIGRKREREGSQRPNGYTSLNPFQSNKRQKVADLDPDKPLPSRENGLSVQGTIYEQEEPRDERIPDSQREAAHTSINGNPVQVRKNISRISATPSPPPQLPAAAHLRTSLADPSDLKINGLQNDDNFQARIQNLFGPNMVQESAARSESTSYHIPRAIQRGTSVSTAATSPLFDDQQAPAMNGTESSNKRKLADVEGPKINGKSKARSENENSIYDTMPSDSESAAGTAILRRTKERLKGKSKSPTGLTGHAWAATKFSTPPNGNRRRISHSQEPVTAEGELPLTPNSKTQQEKGRQQEEAEDVERNGAKLAAAGAAEQRKRDADGAKAAEDREWTRKMEEKEEQRNAVKVKAAQLEKQRNRQIQEAKERKAEEHRLEQDRILRESEEAEQLEELKKARIAREKQEAEKLEQKRQLAIEMERREKEMVAKEKARAAEAKRSRADKTAQALEEKRKSEEGSEQSKASSSDRPKVTPIRPQSSTPFVPSGRKSALKVPSSQAAASPSPELTRTVSITSSNGSRNELEVPGGSKRRVSFNVDELPEAKATPIRPPPILPPPRSALKVSTPVTVPNPTARKSGYSTSSKSTTPIPLPPAKQGSKERSITPAVPPRSALAPKPAAAKPRASKSTPTSTSKPATKSASPAILPPSRETSKGPSKPKELAITASPLPTQTSLETENKSEEEVEYEDDEDEGSVEYEDDLNGPSRVDPVKALNTSLRHPAKASSQRDLLSQSPDSVEDDDKDGDVEMRDVQSNRSSSRSPVVFNSHPPTIKVGPTKSEKPEPSSDESSDEDESVDAEEDTSEEQDEEDKTVKTSVPLVSSHQVPKTSTVNIAAKGKSSQLSSAAVKSTPVPVPSSSAARPKSSFGVTLSSLAKKPIAGTKNSKNILKAPPLKLAENDHESESESEEDSDSGSSSDTDIDELSQTLPTLKRSRSRAEDSEDSDSDLGSDKENENEMESHRSDLAKQIAEMANGSQGSTQSFDTPTAKVIKTKPGSTGSLKAGKKANGRGTEDKYLMNYKFSQPK